MILFILATILFASPGQGQTPIFPNFTVGELDESWKLTGQMIRNTRQEEAYGFFSALKGTPHAVASVRKADICPPPMNPEGDDPIDPPACPMPEPGRPELDVSVLNVYPLTGSEGSAVFTRIQAFQRYQAAHVEYSRYRTDALTAQSIQTIKERSHQSLSELLMLNIRLYYADGNAADKCNRIRRVAALYSQYAQEFPGQDLVASNMNGVNASYDLETVAGKLKKEFNAPQVCTFNLQGNRSQQENQIIQKAANTFDAKVVNRLTVLHKGAQDAGRDLGELSKDIKPANFPIRTQALLDFEKQILNLKSSLEMISQDTFKVKILLDESRKSDSHVYAYAGCGYLATTADYFQQSFDIDPIVLESIVDKCGPIGERTDKPVKNQGASPETLKLAKNYIQDAAYKTTQQIESILVFIKADIVASPALCASGACYRKCSNLDKYLVKDHAGQSLLTQKLVPPALSSKPLDPKDTPQAFYEAFKGDFNSCMDELYRFIETKKSFTMDQKLQAAFAKDLKNVSEKVTK